MMRSIKHQSENRSLETKRLYQGHRENAKEPSGESAKGVGAGMTEHSIIDDILDGLSVREIIAKYSEPIICIQELTTKNEVAVL